MLRSATGRRAVCAVIQRREDGRTTVSLVAGVLQRDSASVKSAWSVVTTAAAGLFVWSLAVTMLAVLVTWLRRH
jgi:hypothetical protein